jgi:hypothetical protein
MADFELKTHDASDSEARRAFLVRCGRFAAVTPPAFATLLAVTSVPREAHASTISLVVPTDTKKGAFTLQIWPAPNESLTFLLQPKPINLSKGGQQ